MPAHLNYESPMCPLGPLSSPYHLVFDFSLGRHHLEGLLKQPGAGLRICISNKLPGDADASGWRPCLETHWSKHHPSTALKMNNFGFHV